ncbi:MAG: hypothetical protein ACXWK8_05680 [Myxococcaceae bacterium]
MRRMLSMLVVGGLLQTVPARAQAAGGQEIAERVAALKQSLAASAKNLRTYQWVETTTVSLNGEQKSMKQVQCYYGADGVLQKIPLAQTQAKAPGGLRGKIAQNKKEELSAEMQQAVALVKSYVPPDPTRLEMAKAAGKVSMDVLQPGKVIRLVFRDYRLPGDSLGITLNVPTNQLGGINVATYLNQPSNPVTMTTQMGTLNDGTTYPAAIQLNLPSKGVSVNVTNTGYRKGGV